MITHWHGSWHKDHRAAAGLTMTAAFFAALPTLERAAPAFTPSLVLFGENWEDDEGFKPAHLVDVSAGFEPWRAAVLGYELARGLASFPYIDYYASLYRLRGCLRGSAHAQSFATTSHSWNAGVGIFNPLTPPAGGEAAVIGKPNRVLAIDLGGTSLRAALAPPNDPAALSQLDRWPAPAKFDDFALMFAEIEAAAGVDAAIVGVGITAPDWWRGTNLPLDPKSAISRRRRFEPPH